MMMMMMMIMLMMMYCNNNFRGGILGYSRPKIVRTTWGSRLLRDHHIMSCVIHISNVSELKFKQYIIHLLKINT